MQKQTVAGVKVLPVEDDKELAGFFGRGLEEKGSLVTTTHHGGDGLRQSHPHTFDIRTLWHAAGQRKTLDRRIKGVLGFV